MALELYGTYLASQGNGFSDALPLPSIVAAFDIDGIPQEERPELTRRLLLIHDGAVEIARLRRRKVGANG